MTIASPISINYTFFVFYMLINHPVQAAVKGTTGIRIPEACYKEKLMKKILTLQNLRRLYSLFFFTLFLLFLFITDYKNMKGYEVSLFLELDPLVAFLSFLTSGTLYKGLAFSLVIIMGTLLLGRFFCSWICPLGILNQWTSFLFNKRKTAEYLEENLYRKSFRFKYYLLLFFIVTAVMGSLQAGLLDPIALTVRSFVTAAFPAANRAGGYIYLKQPLFYGGVAIAFIFVAILFANRFITRFWCRVICPLGALLGVLSLSSLFRIRRDVEKCTDCRKCVHHCQGGCDPHSRLRESECHVCMNCISACPENALRYGLPDSLSSIHQSFDISRRRLVETGIASIIFFPMMKSSLTGERESAPQLIRPPGSLDEKDFLRRCIKCSECMRVCPTNVLQPALFESGLEGLWTPILINKIGYCEHNCTLCGQVCPTGAIRKISIEEKLGKKPFERPVKLGTAFYDRGRCLPWAMDRECIVCEEVCPTSPKAIWYRTVEIKARDGSEKELKRPHLDPDKCIGCGICENKCPVLDKPAIRVTSVGESRSKMNKMILKA